MIPATGADLGAVGVVGGGGDRDEAGNVKTEASTSLAAHDADSAKSAKPGRQKERFKNAAMRLRKRMAEAAVVSFHSTVYNRVENWESLYH